MFIRNKMVTYKRNVSILISKIALFVTKKNNVFKTQIYRLITRYLYAK